MSVFSFTEANSSYPSGTIGQIIVNGVQLYSATATSSINEKDAILALLIGVNYDYTLTSGGGIYTFVVTAEPNIRTITVMLTKPSGEHAIHNFKLNTVGVPSTTECNNCIEDSNLREMYALLNQLLS